MNSPQVQQPKSRCPACGSTERTRYDRTIEEAIDHQDRDGNHCTHVVWRQCHCKQCGQRRVDVTHENRTKKDPPQRAEQEAAVYAAAAIESNRQV